MNRYILADQAKRDLFEIWDYLADQASVDVADRIVTDLREAMSKLAELPRIGHRRDDLTDLAVRFWSVHSYYVIYDPETRPLAIARVLHQARDIPAILQSEGEEAT